eukprot:Ihof_evm5s318 gene=Ihof_evmTU5s318
MMTNFNTTKETAPASLFISTSTQSVTKKLKGIKNNEEIKAQPVSPSSSDIIDVVTVDSPEEEKDGMFNKRDIRTSILTDHLTINHFGFQSTMNNGIAGDVPIRSLSSCNTSLVNHSTQVFSKAKQRDTTLTDSNSSTGRRKHQRKTPLASLYPSSFVSTTTETFPESRARPYYYNHPMSHKQPYSTSVDKPLTPLPDNAVNDRLHTRSHSWVVATFPSVDDGTMINSQLIDSSATWPYPQKCLVTSCWVLFNRGKLLADHLMANHNVVIAPYR